MHLPQNVLLRTLYKHQHTKTGSMPRYHPLACAGGLFAGSNFLLHISYMHCHKKIITTGFQLVNTMRSQKIRGDNPRVFSEVKDTVLFCCQKFFFQAASVFQVVQRGILTSKVLFLALTRETKNVLQGFCDQPCEPSEGLENMARAEGASSGGVILPATLSVQLALIQGS